MGGRQQTSAAFFQPQLEAVEDRRLMAAWVPIPNNAVTVTPDDGGSPVVHIANPATGADVDTVQAYEAAFTGGVRTALGDVNGDGVKDLVIAPGVGGGPRVKILDGKTGAQLADFDVYEPSFTGGLYVAAADVNGDGKADIITGTGVGGGPRVRVLDGASLGQAVLKDFLAYEGSFRGGVLVAGGDVDGDGRADVITGTGVGGGPRVITFSGKDDHVISNFFTAEDSFRGGVLVAAGDVDGDGKADVIAGTGVGGGPVVRVFNGTGTHEIEQFLADDAAFRGGVEVEATDVDGDGRADVVARTRHGADDAVAVFDGRTEAESHHFTEAVEGADDTAAGAAAAPGADDATSGTRHT